VRKQFPQAEYIVVKDIAGGLKEGRRGLREPTYLARRKRVESIVVAYRDKLFLR